MTNVAYMLKTISLTGILTTFHFSENISSISMILTFLLIKNIENLSNKENCFVAIQLGILS